MTNQSTSRRLETAKKKTVRDRNYRRARDRALVRLAQLYPDTYKQLLEIEKAFDEQKGKKWFDINGSTTLTVGTHTRATGADTHTSSRDEQEDESHNGGEA
jgi:hypothetical protein